MKTPKIILGVLIVITLTTSAAYAQQTLTQTVTKLNKSCNNGCSVIDVPELNNNPSAIIFATPVLENGRNLNPHPIGAYFMYMKKWSIYNLDGTPISEGAKFKVEYYLNPEASRFVYVVPKGYDACIDHAGLNENPNASVKAFPTGPPSRGALFNRNEIKVAYDDSASKWCITNLDASFAVPVGTAYNVAFSPGAATASNSQRPSAPPQITSVQTEIPAPKVALGPADTAAAILRPTNDKSRKSVPLSFGNLNDFVEKGIPAPAARPVGVPDVDAVLMARSIARLDENSLPVLLTALQTAGFTIVDENRKALLKPPGDGKGQGLLFYDWETVGMLKTADRRWVPRWIS